MASTVTGGPQLIAKLRAVQAVAPQILNRLAIATVGESKRLSPRRTSNLSRSIHVASITETQATIVASANYAAFVEFGTRGGTIITPKARKALRWAAFPGGARLSGSPRVGAAVVFAKWVRRGATRPQPFMRPGVQAAIAKLNLADEVVAAWDRA